MPVVRNAQGKPFSKWKPAEKFEWQLERCGIAKVLSYLHKEYEFDEVRKWRFDFAWPAVNLAVEIDGFGYGHQAQQHIAANNEKRNAAVEQEWRVLVYDSRMLGSKAKVEEAVEQVTRLMCGAT